MSPTIVGGLRERLIHDSMWHMIHDSLDALDWFDVPTQHGPVTMVADPVDFNDAVELNTISVAETDSRSEGAEMGSNLEDDTTTFYIDFFAENDSLGKHLMGDVRDILRGKIHHIGRSAPVLAVYDWQVDPPRPVLFYCDLEDIVRDRAHNFPNTWQRHWFTCRVDVIDTYGSETDVQFNDFGDLTMGDLF